MKRIRLTREERQIERALLRGEYVDVSCAEFNTIAQAISRRALLQKDEKLWRRLRLAIESSKLDKKEERRLAE